jgi:hypothetical protein
MSELARISTTTEAISYLNTRFNRQLSSSEIEKVPPNTPIAGDSSTKAAFCVLLMLEDQRVFFLKLISNRRFWPRLRSLVGSPPYVFLRPGDDGLLNAYGINRKRAHLASRETRMSAVSDIGFGHFKDAQQRLYKVVAKERPSGSVPWLGLGAGERVVVDVKLKHSARDIKDAVLHGRTENREQLVFPRPGDLLELTLVRQLNPGDGDVVLHALVEGGRQKAQLASIARLVLKID